MDEERMEALEERVTALETTAPRTRVRPTYGTMRAIVLGALTDEWQSARQVAAKIDRERDVVAVTLSSLKGVSLVEHAFRLGYRLPVVDPLS